MKLDRNTNPDGKGKYALIQLRVPGAIQPLTESSEHLIVRRDAVDFGNTADSDFFVIRLKDKYAEMALTTYALVAMEDDEEYAAEILKLARRARNHPNKKRPD